MTLDPIYRIRKVMDLTGLGKSTIYAQIAAGTFPTPVRIGPKSVGWRQSDLAGWLTSREAA